MDRFAIVYSDKIEEYDLGHVLTGERYRHFMDLFQRTLGGRPDFEIVEPSAASRKDLGLVHPEEYIERIESLNGLDPLDTPLSPGFVRAARLLAGAGKLAGELVHSGTFAKAFVVGGGVQHAGRSRERGFGIYSDVGICAENLMRNFGVERVFIIDTDAHAGEGIHEIFYEDPRALCVSIHQDPSTLFPGRGFIHETGAGKGQGCCVNIPLRPGSAVKAYEHVLGEIVAPLAQEFRPQMVLMVDGADPHFTDRLTRMGLTLEGIRTVGALIGQLADRLCRGKIVDFIGSGYSSDPHVVSLGWLASITGVTGVELEMREPDTLPARPDPGTGLEEAQSLAVRIRKHLSSYWKCFQSP